MKRGKRQEARTVDSHIAPQISFVIPAYNEDSVLGGTLDAIHGVGRRLEIPYEILVADDASTDRTAEVARRHGARVVATNNRQIAATRNAGAREARGSVFFFVDADTIVTEEAIRGALTAVRAGACGGGAAVRFDEPVPRYGKLLLAVLVIGFRVARLAGGCFLFCTRDAFERTGGFDETLYASEEIAMSRALKRQGRFVVLRESVITSGRKLRDHGLGTILGALFGLAMQGKTAMRSRRGLGLWYEQRCGNKES